MKALVLEDTQRLVMRDMPVPVPGEHELLIRTRAATICTSDLNDIKHNAFGIRLPMIMGHEGAGDVVAVGSKVSRFRVGDEITAHPVMPCGQCDSCRRGLPHLCDHMDHLGITYGGVFAEYFVIREDRARIIPHATVKYATASLMEPVCVCIEAIKRGNVRRDSHVLVIGDGPFGLIITRLLKQYTDGRIVLLGRHDFRLGHAEGAVTINEKRTENLRQALLEASGGSGFDTAILCVGTGDAVRIGIEALRSRGTLSVFSAVQPAPAVDLFKVHVKELNICGSCNDMDVLDEALGMIIDPALHMDQIVTHQLDFYTKWQEAFRLAEFGKDEAIKVSMIFE